jgi:hypothetical protein
MRINLIEYIYSVSFKPHYICLIQGLVSFIFDEKFIFNDQNWFFVIGIQYLSALVLKKNCGEEFWNCWILLRIISLGKLSWEAVLGLESFCIMSLEWSIKDWSAPLGSVCNHSMPSFLWSDHLEDNKTVKFQESISTFFIFLTVWKYKILFLCVQNAVFYTRVQEGCLFVR